MADEAPKEYHLHKHQPSKLQLAVRDLAPYLKKHGDKATKAHSHSYYQIILFATEGRHYVDYEVVSHTRHTAFVLLPGQIHYFWPDAMNEGRIIQFNEQFLARFDPKARDVIEYRLFNELTPESLTIARPEWEKICGVLDLLEHEIADQKNDYPTQSYHLMRTLITYLERAQEVQYGAIPAASKDYRMA